ncbi:hypothetical protein FQN57_000021 [Myotisia sp. PD_48]|nr:hypothetical protein FQN57_000021 [Myotisia sp. PD_48]
MRVNKTSKSFLLLCSFTLLFAATNASLGDRLPDFKECVKVCKETNCAEKELSLPLHLRLLLWDCASECDYTCQHVVTDRRVARDPPMLEPIVQFHGKWPFHRVYGIQEFFAVLFSLFNYMAHYKGMEQIRESIPESYPLRKFYLGFGYFGLASWIFSMIFHTRDFSLTEKLDYFAAGASVMYGLYLSVVRIFRLDRPRPRYVNTLLRWWTICCVTLYLLHVSYLSFWVWDYTYNMAANVVVGLAQNILWSVFSFMRYKRQQATWTAWPGMIVAWLIFAMSLELLDFPPIGGYIDAHSLWHLGTVIPTIWWYAFLIKDAEAEFAERRFRA